MKYYHNNKKILLVLTSMLMFIFSLMFIACEKQHNCSVCPPTDYSGYIKMYDVSKIYPFLNSDYVMVYRRIKYPNTLDEVEEIYFSQGVECVDYYSSDYTSYTYCDYVKQRIPNHWPLYEVVFHNKDSSLTLQVSRAIFYKFPLFWPQYFVGKKWEHLRYNANTGEMFEVTSREIISIDEVITVGAGTFENVIKIKEVYRTLGWFTTLLFFDYDYHYIRNDIGLIKTERYRVYGVSNDTIPYFENNYISELIYKNY